jgi:hypothetical protein
VEDNKEAGEEIFAANPNPLISHLFFSPFFSESEYKKKLLFFPFALLTHRRYRVRVRVRACVSKVPQPIASLSAFE